MADRKIEPAVVAKPRFFYGYIIVIAGFFIFLAYSGSRSAFSIFFDPMVNQFGWSAALMSGAFSLSIVIDGTLGILMGRFTDKIGPKKVLIICGILAGVGYILISRVTSIWQMYLVYGLLIGTGMSGIFVPIGTNLPRWFIARRNIMNGIVLTGMGLGTLIISPIAYWLITSYGWPNSYVIIGIAFLILVLVPAQFFKSDPAQVGQQPYNRSEAGKPAVKVDGRNYSLAEAIKTRQLWILFGMFFCFGFASLSLSVHIVPHIIHIDISPAIAAAIFAVIGGFNIVGRLAFGAIGDKIGPRQTYLLGFFIIAAILIWLLFIREAWMLYIFAVIWGFSSGGMGSVQTSIVAELFGLKSIGSVFGFCGMGVMIGGSVGPVLVGLLFDIKGDYQIAFIVCALFAIAGIVLNRMLGRASVKMQAMITR